MAIRKSKLVSRGLSMKLEKLALRATNASKAVALAALASFAVVAYGSTPAFAQHGSRAASIDIGGESVVSKSIVLPLNKAAIVDLPRAAADVLVSQPSIVDAVVRSPRRVFLLGLEAGQTNAFFFDTRGRQILNLEIQVERDIDALSGLLRRTMPDSRIELDSVNGNIILRGEAQTASEAATAHTLAARFAGDAENVINMIAVRESEQVMLKVRIVEMQRSLMKQLGVQTNGSVTLSDVAFNFASANAVNTGAGLAADGTLFRQGNLNQLDASIEALETTGLVRILAEPNLTTISGESARFLAGGEFPIPVGQDDGVISIEFKEFGVGLGFTPVVLSKGRISMQISTEVSEVTTDNAFFVPSTTATDEDGNTITTTGLTIPGLTVRRANTTIELPSGGSLVLAGLLQEDMRATIDGVPGVKDVPVLGQLFRSRDYQNSETELIIIATPYIVKPTHDSELKDPTEGFVAATDLQSIVTGKLVSTYGLANAGVDEASLQGPLGFILD